jgi:hypothetical protein
MVARRGVSFALVYRAISLTMATAATHTFAGSFKSTAHRGIWQRPAAHEILNDAERSALNG